MPVIRPIFALAMMLAALPAWAGEQRPPSVLILEHSDPGLPYFIQVSATLRSTLKANSATPVSIYSESLDLGRFSGPRYEEDLRTFIRGKYRDRPIGTIVAVGQGSLEFALRERENLWHGVPIIFTTVDEHQAARMTLPGGVTGLTARMTLRDSVTAAKALVPGLRRIVLVGDALERQTYRRFASNELPMLAAEFELIDLRGLPISDVRARLSSLPADAAIFYLGITTDGAGAEFLTRDALKIVSETANRPIIVDSEPHLGFGGTGGFVTDPSIVGRAAARIALRVLDGEDASAIPVSPGNSRRPVFDWRELQRWKVSEAMLPPGSEVRFRAPTLWETYRNELVAVALIILLQTGMIAALLIERRRRRRAEIEARRRFVEIAHMSRTATAGALSASIAHELRQPLAAILSNAEAAEMLLDGKEPDLALFREILVDIIGADQRASEIIGHLRGLLKPGASDPTETDLNHAAKDVLHIVRAEADKRGITLGAELDRRPLMVRADLVHLQQIILNLSMNAMDAMLGCAPGKRNLLLETTQVGDSSVEVTVSDSGEGIPPEKLKSIFEPFFTTKEHGIGLGLSIVRTIVETYGGKIWAENRAGGGAVLRFTLPLARALA